MADMLVKLYDVQEKRELYEKLQKKGICIKRALGLDASLVYRFIEENEFSARWVDGWPFPFSLPPVILLSKKAGLSDSVAMMLLFGIFWDLWG